MKVLLSIKPEYSKKIFSGEKKFEFRKCKPKCPIDGVIVYETSPTKKLVGSFNVKKIHSGSPEQIWEKCKNLSGIKQLDYVKYCHGTKIIHAFEIERASKFENPHNPFDKTSDFRPPQNFFYLDDSMLSEILEKS
jgi:predicted transcriptional regulator